MSMTAPYPAGPEGASLQDYDFMLPDEQIATRPSQPRSHSRLLVLRADEPPIHTSFDQLGSFLSPGDLLVANNARVCPWRLDVIRERTRARVELLFLAAPRPGIAEAICRPASKVRPGERLVLGSGFRASVLERHGGRCRLLLPVGIESLTSTLGHLPLPPYILHQRRVRGESLEQPTDRQDYQTVYASVDGAIAAPTAGLHFTPELLDSIRAQGIGWAELSLLVGPGTFEPVRVPSIAEHRVEAETYSIPGSTWSAIESTRHVGNRVISVGTTTCRALEAAAQATLPRLDGQADLTILPGHQFRVVDALITNFHLPRSSLLLLVSAFAGRERILEAYRDAVARGYRFYSYGDAMLIDPGPPRHQRPVISG
jgi:S-adenosylmethionine:tRNA ribosyltransferase-isomerase